jgi:hypothetical protein
MSNKAKQLPMAALDDAECCSPAAGSNNFIDNRVANRVAAEWKTGTLETPAGPVYQVSTSMDRRDRLGSFKARWGVGRMNYTIPPGLYAAGNPDHHSPVLVSANYKLSFDYLRRELAGLDLWLLVLDTKGINVWCAAGKGSFGTVELVRMVKQTRLNEIISHRTLILPQLAAPGVSAWEVRKASNYRVIYGPVRAADIPAYLNAGKKASVEMRHPSFGLIDRLVLTPVELIALLKPLAALFLLLGMINIIVSLLSGTAQGIAQVLGNTLTDFLPFLIAAIIGSVLVPAFLPCLPGRSFTWKGFLAGIIWALCYLLILRPEANWLHNAGYLLILPSITAFLSLNFTGSSTYTSLSGVVKEMTYALPLMIGSAGLGLVALIGGYFL